VPPREPGQAFHERFKLPTLEYAELRDELDIKKPGQFHVDKRKELERQSELGPFFKKLVNTL
jgi:hypothetical protein